MSATLQNLLAFLLTFVVAGWLAGLIVLPERLPPVTRVLLSLALSVPATVVVATLALMAGRLEASTLLVGFAGLAVLAALRVAPGVLSARRAGVTAVDAPSGPSTRPHDPVRPARRWRWAMRLLTGGAALLLLGVVLLAQLSVRTAEGIPPGTTWWYYYALVLDMLDARAIPATIGEWGSARPYPVEYLATTVHTAATAIFGGLDLAFMEAYRLIVLVLVAVAAYALWRRWLPAWWAWVAAILTICATRLSSRLVGYRPETFGLALVFWSAWLLDEALARRSLRWGLLAGLVSGTAFHAHAEVWLLTGPLWMGIIASRLATAIWRSFRQRRRSPTVALSTAEAGTAPEVASPAQEVASPQVVSPAPATAPGRMTTRRQLAASVGVLGAAALAFVLVGALAIAAGTGSRLAGLTDKPASTVAGPVSGDPTWEFFGVINDFDVALSPAPTDFWDPFLQDPATTVPYPGIYLNEPLPLIVTVLALAFVLLHLRHGLPRTRRMVLTWLLFAAGVLVGAYVIFLFYDTYVPQRAGPRRILPFYTIALAGLYAVAVYLLERRLMRLVGRSYARSGELQPAADEPPSDDIQQVLRQRPVRALALRAGGIVAAVLLVGMLLPTSDSLGLGGRALSREGYAALQWMRDNLPGDRIVLANAYTDGSIGAVSRMTGWIDGRAPYLEDPAWLAEATRNVRTARDFYYDPEFYGPPQGVDYVLAGRTEDLAGYATMEVYWEGFAASPRLKVVKEFLPNELMLYEILPEPPPGEEPP
ncbi:MAG: glycosyltransferase family 39 protein, partial [Chloroflexi bacterium]|nr:glycosyltransferase family 39 protein [Chloroflexota bacterium]